MSKTRLRSLTAILVVLLGAFALRIFRLDSQSLWWDEGISLHLATSSWVEIVRDRAANIHPPLYFFILKVWAALVGVTPFAARYLSVLVSLLQVTAVYAVSRRWFGRTKAAWLGLILIAISPLSVIYGQETRVYAFMPLFYLALLFQVRLLAQTSSEKSGWFWWGLGILEWTALHLHYTTLFLVVFLNVWLVLVYFRRRDWLPLKRWLITQTAVALASLPWLIIVFANRFAVQGRVQTAKFITEPVNWRFLLAQVGVFHLTGLPGALARPEVQILGGAVFAGLLLLWLWRLRDTAVRRQAFLLAAFWLLPLSMALSIWSLRSFSHPRYLIAFAIGLLPFAAFLLFPGGKRDGLLAKLLAGVVGVGLLTISILGLGYYFFDPDVAKDDVRGVARYLETAVSPNDLIVVPDIGWALEFEYNGRAPIVYPELANPDAMWQNFAEWTSSPRQIFTMMSATDNRDWQNVIPYALESAGAQVATTRFDGLVVRQYDIFRPVVRPQLDELTANFGDLQLLGAAIENDVAADSAITLALRWQKTGANAPRSYLGLRLLDVDGWLLRNSSSLLLDPAGRPTDFWQIDQLVTTYHVLPIPPGTPPLTYNLALGLAAEAGDGGQRPFDLLDAAGSPQGQQLVLTDNLTLAAGLGLENPYRVKQLLPRLSEPVTVAPGLSLVAAGLDRGEVGPGQSLLVSLEWLAATAPLADVRPQVVLRQGQTDLVAASDAPAQGRYPTNLWAAGERVVEHRSLRIPADAAASTAVIAVVWDDLFVEIGTVDIAAEARLFAPPLISEPLAVQFGQTARLVGYDLPVEQVTAGDTVPLTLYWESLAEGDPVSYTVFAHVLAEDGRLIGQHDAPPINGTRPTTGWVVGEYLIDPHPMTFREPDYVGAASIEVGLYDPKSGTRLLTADGQDHVILPVTLAVTASE